MVSAFRDKLSDVQRAPKRVSRTSLMGTKSLIHNAAPVVIRECLTGNPKGFTARRVLDQVPALAAIYTDANALGTALGDGVRGKGLGLHRDGAGDFRRCRDNAALAAAKLNDDKFAALAAELVGVPDGLADAIDPSHTRLINLQAPAATCVPETGLAAKAGARPTFRGIKQPRSIWRTSNADYTLRGQ